MTTHKLTLPSPVKSLCCTLLLGVATLACGTSYLAAQDITPPPAPPGQTNIVYWDVNVWKVSMQPDGSVSENDGHNGEFSPDDSGPPSPGGGSGGDGGSGGGGGGSDVTYNLLEPGTNLWLLISQISANEVQITLSNTIPGNPYILEVATNLLGPWFTNQSLLATNTISLAQPIPIEALDGVFFRAQQAVIGTVRWRTLLDTNDFSSAGLEASPALSEDGTTVYMVGVNSLPSLAALDFLTGEPEWISNFFTPNEDLSSPQPPEFIASATVSGTNVYVGGQDGDVYGFYPDGMTNLNLGTGADNGIYGTPAIGSNGVLYVPLDEGPLLGGGGTTNGGLMSLNLDGSVNWVFRPQDLRYGQAGDVDTSPAVDSTGATYFLAEGHRFYCVNSQGQIRWMLPVPGLGEPDSAAAIGRQAIYVGSTSSFLYAINFDGSLRWALNINDGPVLSSPVVGNSDGVDTVYAATEGNPGYTPGTVVAVTNGVIEWQFSDPFGGAFLYSAPALGKDGTVYIEDYTGGASEFMAITNSGTNVGVEWSASAGSFFWGSSPIITQDGTVVVGNNDGYLYAFWGGTPPATNAPWPQFLHDNQHTGAQPSPLPPVDDCAAPFVYNGTNDGNNFSFQIVGEPGTNWNVYSSEDLSNWTQIGTNIPLTLASADELSGTNTFTDATVSGVAQRFYQLSNGSNCCSRAIGFINMSLVSGSNLVAAPFDQVDDYAMDNSGEFPMNSLASLFGSYDPWGPDYNGTEVVEWTGQDLTTNDTFTWIFGPQWLNKGSETLLPGSSAFIVNVTNSSLPVSFVGLVREQQSFQIQSQTNYLGASAPVAGWITNVTGYTPRAGDLVQLWDTTNQTFSSHRFTGTAWTNGTPFLNVAEGFVLITTNSYSWTNSWEHTVCAGP